MRERDFRKRGGRVLLMVLFFFGTVLMSFGQEVTLFGDVNRDGSINILDALKGAQYSAGGAPEESIDLWAADVNIDGFVNIIDALAIARYSADLIPSLPIVASKSGSAPVPQLDTTYMPPIVKVDNPFWAANWYVNPHWAVKAASGGRTAMTGFSTAVWLDSVNSLYGYGGLQWHMDHALDRGDDLIVLVLYNIPNRDCAAYSSTSVPVFPDDDGFNSYMHEYIDPIHTILSDSRYSGINIVTIIEPDSLANLVTNMDLSSCQDAAGPGGYVDGIQYAVNSLSRVENVYIYMDISHSGWMGWESNLGPMATFLSDCIKGTANGVESVQGFVSNAGFYTPVEEVFLPDPYLSLVEGGMQIRSSNFYEWNDHFDELSYTASMYDALVAKGFPSNIGIIIDTSRNGWGGSNRPTAVSTSSDIDTYVNESRIDRRAHRGNWCNQTSGLGARPQASPGASHIDAYVWVKPPGVSDGVSTHNFEPDPRKPTAVFDMMCDPDGLNIYCNCAGTGALAGAPHVGLWNETHFEKLIEYAYPPVE